MTTTATRLVPMLLALASCAALSCSRASSGPATPGAPEAPPAASVAVAPKGQVTGTVGGLGLTVRSAVFLWREKADDLALVLSDTEDLCGALSAGAWPKGATLFRATLKHNAPDNRNAPFGAGEYPLRQGGDRKPQDTKQAALVRLDASCSPSSMAKATAGLIRLTTPAVKVGGTAEGSLDLTMAGGERIEGTFAATFCPPTENEPSGCR